MAKLSELDIKARIARFRADLPSLGTGQVVQRHLTTGPSALLDDDEYHTLRSRVATEFGIHPNEILVVGSAKLGFSLVDEKRYRHFGDESDIDVALVSPALFADFWRESFDYWKTGSYWPGQERFQQYLFRGWIRPDKLPPKLIRATRWWEFFKRLSAEEICGPYQIRAGLYGSWHFLEAYQSICVDECRRAESP